MANQDFDINIRINADTTQVETIRKSFEKLGAQVEVTNRQAAAAGGGLGKGADLIGAVGLPTTAVGIGLALNSIIKQYGEYQLAIAKQLDQQLTTLTALAQKWAEVAKAADSAADVNKLGQAGVNAIHAAQEEFTKFQNQTTSWWQDMIDSFVKGPTFGGTIFEKMANEQSARLAENVQRTREAAISATKLGESYKEAFEKLKAGDLSQAVTELTTKIEELGKTQKAVGIDNIESWTAIGRQIEIYKGQLKEVQALQEQASKEREKGTAATQKEIGGASPQAQRILMNEAAMQRARAAGQEIDAAMFEKSAQAFRRGATQQQLGEVEKIYSSPDVVAAINRLADLWR